ncbi:hypothetical protein Tco_0583372 [Tanacetum coccineum]
MKKKRIKDDTDDDKSINLEMTDDEETDDEFVHGVEQVNNSEDEEMTNAEFEESGNAPIPTPPITIESPTITTVVPEFGALTAIQLRVAKLEKDVFELKNIDLFAEDLATLKSQVPNVVDEYHGPKLSDAL